MLTNDKGGNVAIFETKHMRSRLEVLKKHIRLAFFVFSCLSMLAFLSYNIYLLAENFNNLFYLIVYSVLIVTMIALFVVDLCVKEGKPILKNHKSQLKEKKFKTKLIIKIFKYMAKACLVGVAMYETLTNYNASLSNVLNICSAVLLLVQIVVELFMVYIVKQIDCFRLSFELDVENSKAFVKKFFPMMNLEKEAIIEQGESVYTEHELKLIEQIKNEAKECSKKHSEKRRTLMQIIKDSKKKKEKKNPFKNWFKKRKKSKRTQ